jgi:acyl carrier protein
MPFLHPTFRKTATCLVSVWCCATGLQHTPAIAQGAAETAAKCGQVPQATEQAIVRVLKIQQARLRPGLRLVEDLGANEQRLASLTMQLEDAFLVILPDELADGSGTTMGSYIDALDKALGCPVRR